jgi:hypothetical protein
LAASFKTPSVFVHKPLHLPRQKATSAPFSYTLTTAAAAVVTLRHDQCDVSHTQGLRPAVPGPPQPHCGLQGGRCPQVRAGSANEAFVIGAPRHVIGALRSRSNCLHLSARPPVVDNRATRRSPLAARRPPAPPPASLCIPAAVSTKGASTTRTSASALTGLTTRPSPQRSTQSGTGRCASASAPQAQGRGTQGCPRPLRGLGPGGLAHTGIGSTQLAKG